MTRRATEKNAGEMAGAISGMRGRSLYDILSSRHSCVHAQQTPLMPAKFFE
jgi:hypothetical protein